MSKHDKNFVLYVAITALNGIRRVGFAHHVGQSPTYIFASGSSGLGIDIGKSRHQLEGKVFIEEKLHMMENGLCPPLRTLGLIRILKSVKSRPLYSRKKIST
jgi:hypothetical protein